MLRVWVLVVVSGCDLNFGCEFWLVVGLKFGVYLIWVCFLELSFMDGWNWSWIGSLSFGYSDGDVVDEKMVSFGKGVWSVLGRGFGDFWCVVCGRMRSLVVIFGCGSLIGKEVWECRVLCIIVVGVCWWGRGRVGSDCD